MTTSPDHDHLVERAVRWLRTTRRCSVVFAEMTTALPVTPDAIGWARGVSILVEAKVSRSDFFADRKKAIFTAPDSAPGAERWYITPPGLVAPDEVPEAWGLLEVHTRIVRRVVQAQLMPHHGRARAEVVMLLSAVRRHQLGSEWYGSQARFQPLTSPTQPRTPARVRQLTMGIIPN